MNRHFQNFFQSILIKKILVLVFFFTSILKAQNPDSLTGTYIGQYHYKSTNTLGWIITQDTMIVTMVDTSACTIDFNGIPMNMSTFYSDYSFCNPANPTNYYTKFYAQDSIRVIADNISPPPPNQLLQSRRFFGKRIGALITDINPDPNLNLFEIFPNPANEKLYIKQNAFAHLEVVLFDIRGKQLSETIKGNDLTEIDISNLIEGIYFVQIKSGKGIISKKVIVQR